MRIKYQEIKAHDSSRAHLNRSKKRKPGKKLGSIAIEALNTLDTPLEKLMKACSITHSFSPSDRPCNNAVAESLFSSLKKEELYRADYRSTEELMRHIDQYIEFHNTKRPYATLGFKTPVVYERRFLRGKPRKRVENNVRTLRFCVLLSRICIFAKPLRESRQIA